MAQDDPFAEFAVAESDDPFAAFAVAPVASHAPAEKHWYDGYGEDPSTAKRPGWRQIGRNVIDQAPMIGATVATGGLGPTVGAGGRILAGVLGAGGGEGLRQTAKAAMGDTDTAQTPAGVGMAMGTQGVVQGGLPQAAGEAGPSLFRGGNRMMQSALKPSQALVNARKGAGFGSKDAVAQAVLDEGRLVTRGGAVKAQTALDATDAGAHAALRGGVGRGVTVDPFEVTDAIDAQRTGLFGRQVNAQPDTAAIQQVHENFATNPHVADPVGGMAQMDPVLAHEFASNTGKNLKGKFGRLGGATVEAEKAARGNISGQLRDKIPELKEAWDTEARQMTVRDALENALERQGNRDPVGPFTFLGAMKNPVAALGMAADRSGGIKSALAHAMQGASRKTPTPDMVRAALAALMSSHERTP